jgi:hypothetical protein
MLSLRTADGLKPSVPFRVRPMLATLVSERAGRWNLAVSRA